MVVDSFCHQLLILGVFRIQVFGDLLLSTNKMPSLLQSSESICHFPTWAPACLTNLLGTKIPAPRKSVTVDTGTWIRLQGSRTNAMVSFENLQGVGSARQTNPSHTAGCAAAPSTHMYLWSAGQKLRARTSHVL